MSRLTCNGPALLLKKSKKRNFAGLSGHQGRKRDLIPIDFDSQGWRRYAQKRGRSVSSRTMVQRLVRGRYSHPVCGVLRSVTLCTRVREYPFTDARGNPPSSPFRKGGEKRALVPPFVKEDFGGFLCVKQNPPYPCLGKGGNKSLT